MEREEAHDFYLLRIKKEADLLKEQYYRNLLYKKETDQYVLLDNCYFHSDFIEYLYPSLTGLSTKLHCDGVSLIKDKADAEKLIRICTGWIMVISEMAEYVLLSDWETKFKRVDLLHSMKKLKHMSEQMKAHDDYNIFYWGI